MNITTILLFLNILNAMGYSLLAPLFPTLGKKNGLSDALIGWIISAFSVSNTLITPFIPSLAQKFTRTKVLYFSTFLVAACTICYSFLYYITSLYSLVIISMIIRIIHGGCSGIVFTLVYSLTISLSEKEHLQKSLGYLELGLCFGTSCGPLVASIFYRIGGYPLPFIVLGFFLFLSVYLTNKMEKKEINSNENQQKEALPFFKFFAYSEILVIAGCFFIAMISATYYLPCLTNYLIQRYNYSVSVASLFFIIPTTFYITILQLLDLISKRIGLYGTSSLGLFITALGAFLLAPIFSIFDNIFLFTFGFGLLGAGQAPIFIPLLIALSKSILKIEKNIDELTANDIATSLNNIFVASGEFSGPIIGGSITTYLDFNYCCFLVSLFIIIYFVLFTFYFYDEIFHLKSGQKLLEETNNSIINNDIKEIKNFNKSFIFYGKLLLLNNNEHYIKKRKNTFNNLERSDNLNRVSLFSSLTQ